MRAPKQPNELTVGEWAIMKAVWKREPCTAPDIQEELQRSRGWAYSTVRTLMDRMVAKGLLTSAKVRHMDLYRSVIAPGQAQEAQLLHTLKHAFNNALTPMLQCLLDTRKLSGAELEEMEDLLRQKRKRNGKRK